MKTRVYALYNDDDILLASAKELAKKGIAVTDVFSPFPIHGLDPVIGLKRTRIAICSFLYAVTGLSLALLGIWYFMISDWPMNIGGKPNFSLVQNIPSFIPVSFEFTVFCAAHGMALTMFIRSRLFPGVTAINPDPRTTNDSFMIQINLDNQKVSLDKIKEILSKTGAIEITEK